MALMRKRLADEAYEQSVAGIQQLGRIDYVAMAACGLSRPRGRRIQSMMTDRGNYLRWRRAAATVATYKSTGLASGRNNYDVAHLHGARTSAEAG